MQTIATLTNNVTDGRAALHVNLTAEKEIDPVLRRKNNKRKKSSKTYREDISCKQRRFRIWQRIWTELYLGFRKNQDQRRIQASDCLQPLENMQTECKERQREEWNLLKRRRPRQGVEKEEAGEVEEHGMRRKEVGRGAAVGHGQWVGRRRGRAREGSVCAKMWEGRSINERPNQTARQAGGRDMHAIPAQQISDGELGALDASAEEERGDGARRLQGSSAG
jgi:hypothetical protein